MDRNNQAVNRSTNKKRDRGPDWNETETTFLLAVAKDVQLKNGRSDLNFTTTDMAEILALFKQQFPHCGRTALNLKTRIGTIKKEFSIFYGWANTSGWNWNYDKHEPNWPSPEIMKETIEKGGKRTKYFAGKKFPWYATMEELMGGGKTKGAARDKDHEGTQASAAGSQTGSSDNPPDDGVEDATTEGSVHVSRSSDSNKRNSTDSTELSTRAKRLHLRASERRSEIKEMNATGKEIVKSVKHYAKVKRSKKDEINECLKKLNDLNVRGHLRYMCVEKMELQTFRSLILSSSLEQIKEHFQYDEMNRAQHQVNLHHVPQQQGSNLNQLFTPPNQYPQQQGPNPHHAYMQGPFMQYFQSPPPPSHDTSQNYPHNLQDAYNTFNLDPHSPNH